MALCLAALVATGLLGRTLQNLASTEVGFEADGLFYATVNPVQAGQPRDCIASYLTRLEEALAVIPGVDAVAPLRDRMLQGGGYFDVVATPDGPPPLLDGGQPNPEAFVILNAIGIRALETLQVPLLSGRSLTALDVQAARRVALVDELFAARFFPGQDPIGRSYTWNEASVDVVGLVRATRQMGLRRDAMPTDLSRLVVRDALAMLAAGVLLGLPAAYIVARSLQASLFDLQPADPLMFGLSLVSLTAVALVAAWLPAHRATRISPVDALRET